MTAARHKATKTFYDINKKEWCKGYLYIKFWKQAYHFRNHDDKLKKNVNSKKKQCSGVEQECFENAPEPALYMGKAGWKKKETLASISFECILEVDGERPGTRDIYHIA